ncbi:MAG: GFA family protein [Gammaproteobacteria bacterium]|nr:GFA family protein [Gammaproteobacteria bacterium]
MATGSCLCATLRWQLDGPFGDMRHCHCTMCRKAHAAAFATYVDVPGDSLAWTAGERALVTYSASPQFERAFCGTCGSVVPCKGSDGRFFAPAGCFDDDAGIRPVGHIFVASKAPWHNIADDLPQHATWPQAHAAPVFELERDGASEAGVLRGSCLCGEAVYEVTGEIEFVHNCHCSRCRKARAAAHTTNGFTVAGGVRYLQGAELLRKYKVPDAEYFTHTFCNVCGSGMPRPDAATKYVSIPFGTLDDDPGRGADDHIYTAYKAGWYDFDDGLPVYKERPNA